MKNNLFLTFGVCLSTFLVGCIPFVGGGKTDTETQTQTDTQTQSDTMVDVNQAPNAYFDSSVDSTTLSFDASGSIDIDGEIVSYKWFLNRQLVSESVAGTTQILHNGLNFLNLEIEDDEGLITYSDSRIFDVTDVDSDNLPPMISQVVTTSGTMASFQSVTTIDDSDTPKELNYYWYVDGVEQSNKSDISIEFPEGAHSYELVVTDSDGLASSTGELEFVVNEDNNAPIGEIVVSNQKNNYVKVDTFNVFDADGDNITYHWFFGDGGESRLSSAAHRYEKAGIYVATLKLSDGIDTTTITKSIRVIEDMPFVPVVNNMIENGDLESGLSNHWSSRGQGDIELSTDSNSGDSSILVSNRTQFWEGVRYTFDEKLTEGNEYQFYAWVKLAQGETAEAVLTMHYIDATGVNYNNIARTIMNVDDWRLLHTTFTYYGQGEVTNMWVYVESTDPTATYYVDDFAVTGVIEPVLTLPEFVDINVDTTTNFQFIDGFGAATPMWDVTPWSDEQTKQLVGTDDNDLGLSILRTNISPEQEKWSDYAHMLAVADEHSEDLQIMGTPWSPPAHMKDNNKTGEGGKLLKDYYTAYAIHLDDFVIYMKNQDVKIDVISVQNEPDFYATYESCEWTGEELLDFVSNHANWINNTKVMASESLRFNREYTDPILNDAKALTRMEIVGGHLYSAESSGYFAPYPLAEETGRQIWMTEWAIHLADETRVVDGQGNESVVVDRLVWSDESNEKVWDETLDQVIGSVHKSMIVNWNAYIYWWAKRYYSFMGDGVSDYGTVNGEILKRGWAFSHYSKYVRPGALRVQANVLNSNLGLDVTSYQKDGEIILVVINSEETDAFGVNLGIAHNIDSAEFYNTSVNYNREKLEVAVEGQTAQVNIPARSISTIVLKY